MKNLITFSLLMVFMIISSCEKEVPIMDLTPGATYEDGIVIDVTNGIVTLMESEDVGEFLISEIEAQEYGDWHIPNDFQAQWIFGTARANYPETYGLEMNTFYWEKLKGVINMRENTPSGQFFFSQPDGSAHRLRLVRTIE